MKSNEHDSNLSQRTAELLRERICENQLYKPEEKLPNELILSEELGVSRTTLREAIRTLVSEGILSVKRGKGTFVTPEIDRPNDGVLPIQGLENMKVTLRDLYETRLIFEPEAAALACRRATDAEIEEILRLGEVCQENLKRNPTGKERIRSEAEFHNAIIKACHNDFLTKFMPVLTETIEKTFDMDFNLDVIAEDAYKDHIMIMEFLGKRDENAVKSAVTIHLHHAILNENIEL